jgi:hypothetical protein
LRLPDTQCPNFGRKGTGGSRVDRQTDGQKAGSIVVDNQTEEVQTKY